MHSVNLKEKRLETGKQNMKIISEKKIIQTFLFVKKVADRLQYRMKWLLR